MTYKCGVEGGVWLTSCWVPLQKLGYETMGDFCIRILPSIDRTDAGKLINKSLGDVEMHPYIQVTG